MDDQLKKLMEELGGVIHESVADSERIAEVMAQIQRAGYDVFMVLDITIGFTVGEASEAEEPSKSSGKIELTAQDQKFLQALKIAAG